MTAGAGADGPVAAEDAGSDPPPGGRAERDARVERLLRRSALGAALLAVVVVPFLVFADEVDRLVGATLTTGTSRLVLAVVVFVLLAADILAPVPSSVVCVGGGAVLGIAAGTAVAAAGLTAGCLVGLVLGRWLGAPGTRWVLGSRDTVALRTLLERRGLPVLVVARAVPVMAEASVFLAGATAMPLLRTSVVLAASNVGVAGAYAVAGSWVSGTASFVVVCVASWILPALGIATVHALPRHAAAGARLHQRGTSR